MSAAFRLPGSIELSTSAKIAENRVNLHWGIHTISRSINVRRQIHGFQLSRRRCCGPQSTVNSQRWTSATSESDVKFDDFQSTPSWSFKASSAQWGKSYSQASKVSALRTHFILQSSDLIWLMALEYSWKVNIRQCFLYTYVYAYIYKYICIYTFILESYKLNVNICDSAFAHLITLLPLQKSVVAEHYFYPSARPMINECSLQWGGWEFREQQLTRPLLPNSCRLLIHMRNIN